MKVLAAMLAAYDKVIDFIEDNPQKAFLIYVVSVAAALVL